MLGSEIKVSCFAFGEVLSSPNAETLLFRRLRSGYPLAGCSPAEPASVSPDETNLNTAWKGVNLGSQFGKLLKQKNLKENLTKHIPVHAGCYECYGCYGSKCPSAGGETRLKRFQSSREPFLHHFCTIFRTLRLRFYCQSPEAPPRHQPSTHLQQPSACDGL